MHRAPGGLVKIIVKIIAPTEAPTEAPTPRAPLGSDQTRSQNTVCITRGGELWALNNPQILSWPLGHFQERAQRQSRELC